MASATVALGLIALSFAPLQAQGSLSAQVLRLLLRDNTWTGLQTYGNGTLLLDSASGAPVSTSNRLYNVGGVLYWNGTLVTTVAVGSGTVTSVGLTLPGIFSVSGSPVTTSGTLAATLQTQLANTVFAAPDGSNGTPGFRALSDVDIPDTITINGTNNVTWGSVDKTGSSLADLATRSASDLDSGTLPDGRFPATLPAASGVNLTALNATNLASGTVDCARLPALTGDVTTSACAATLANSGVTANTYGSATAIPVITVDAKGRVTGVSTSTVSTGSSTVAVANGGTNLTSYAVGDLLYASGATTLSKLADVATTNVLISGGVGVAPSWGKVALATAVSGTLGAANGGTAITSTPTDGQLLIGKTATNAYVLATLTGTANEITVTNGSGTITLSTPQAIATTSTPQFARLGLGTGPDSVAVLKLNGLLLDTETDLGNSGAALTINMALSRWYKTTLTANTTFTANNPVAGTRYTFFLTQDGTGTRTVTWFAGIRWAGGSAPTLTVTASKTDIITCLYDGTSYFCDKQLNY